MKKSLFFTVGAAILILLLAAAVFLSVSPDPFRASGDTTGITAENVIGDISLRRSGNNYTLNSGDPSQTTLETWQKFAFSMLDLAKRMGLE